MNVSFNKILLSFSLSVLLVFSVSCLTKEHSEKKYHPEFSENPIHKIKKRYIFGVHPLHNPKKLFEVYLPLVNYLNLHLKDSVIKLEASRNYSSYDKKLFNRHFHLSLPNPYQTVMSLNHGYYVFGKMADDFNFRGIFIARKDSKISDVDQIKGKTVSYPAPTALAATMMPQWFLHSKGININSDINNSYVGSQESSIMNVYLKKTIIGATWPPPWKAFAKDRPEIAKDLHVVWETPSLINNGLVVRDDVPKEFIKTISELIFNLHKHAKGKKILGAMHLSHYEKANNSTFYKVNSFLEKFVKEVRPIRIKKDD